MPVHEVAQRGFDSGADAYERSRPSYPPDAVAWLVENCAIRPGATVCDLAAGTGKLTRLLRPAGANLVAVEPVEAMSHHLRALLPSVPVAAGTAEAIPFADAALDAVTVAQAFHWFDAERAFTELARVLRPGGRVGLVWNARDRSVPWVDKIWGVLDRVEKHAPWRDHERWNQAALGSRAGFGPVRDATFHHQQVLSPEGVVERFESVSHVAVLPRDERAKVLDAMRAVLVSDPESAGRDELAIPYRVDAYWCERL